MSSPVLSPDGLFLAWLTWDHPDMPWDASRLWSVSIDEDLGFSGVVTCVTGEVERESLFQPAWSPEGVLHCVSDRSGWWNLYRCEEGELQPVCPITADCGVAQWVFAMRTYTFLDNGSIACVVNREGQDTLGIVSAGEWSWSAELWTVLSPTIASFKNEVYVIAAHATVSPQIRCITADGDDLLVYRRAGAASVLSEEVLSQPVYFTVSVPGSGEFIYGLFYAPLHEHYVGLPEEKPP